MSDMDWAAAMNSEIFREYAKNEMNKEAAKRQEEAGKLAAADDEELKTMEEFAAFEREVKASPKKLEVFRALQKKFASDPAYTAKAKKSFVEAVMLLNLE